MILKTITATAAEWRAIVTIAQEQDMMEHLTVARILFLLDLMRKQND